MDTDRILWPLAAALVAVPIGWIVTHWFLALTGYPGDPADGPAVTGAAIYAFTAFAVVSWLRSRAKRRG